jgi:hypothetical protein
MYPAGKGHPEGQCARGCAVQLQWLSFFGPRISHDDLRLPSDPVRADFTLDPGQRAMPCDQHTASAQVILVSAM